VQIELLGVAVLARQAVMQDLQLLPADGAAGLGDRDAIAHQDAHCFAIERVLGFQLTNTQMCSGHPISGSGAHLSNLSRVLDHGPSLQAFTERWLAAAPRRWLCLCPQTFSRTPGTNWTERLRQALRRRLAQTACCCSEGSGPGESRGDPSGIPVC